MPGPCIFGPLKLMKGDEAKVRFKSVFSIIGPAMVGPSSSHTAGAVRIGRVARRLLGKSPVRVRITLYGSFAETYRGHGTDLALAAGLLDYDTDDPRIARSFGEAANQGMEIELVTGVEQVPHPNTARLEVWSNDGFVDLLGSSIGGGSIVIRALNGFDVKFTGGYPTLIIAHSDYPGFLAKLTGILSGHGVNIGFMAVDRAGRNREAMTVIEADSPLHRDLIAEVGRIACVHRVYSVDLSNKGGEDDEIQDDGGTGRYLPSGSETDCAGDD